MKSLQNKSISTKITTVIMIGASAALIVACLALFVFEAWTIRKRFADELAITGRLVASNVAVAAMFTDEDKATVVLESLRALPQIVCAGVVLNDGKRLAQFGKELENSAAPVDSTVITNGNRLFFSEPLMREGQRHGTLYLQADFREAYWELLKIYGGILATVLASSLILTYFLSGRLGHWLTVPILRLTKTARQIGEDIDYSARVEKISDDEIGTLTDAFNQMLTQIQAQDADLQCAQKNLRDQLEKLEMEVTERKAAEEALRKSQEKLLQTSRMAGMAEVATSVLHNVGNVLNSVNVSGNVLNERLHSSKLVALGKVTNLINEHSQDFSAFVANDPRGKRLPELVSTVNNALQEEHKELIAEVVLISKNIGHIKEIVAMQQSYARVGGLIEQLEVEDLVEDALRMNAVSLSRHHVSIAQDYETVPKVQVDRHKVLQILVNLLSNAKHAVDDSGHEDKKVVMRIRNNGGHFVKISVEDNGIGIAPENLTRIFAHGFTTKEAGHGFGLHSSCLAADEVGGSLSVHSDGVGKGATFTLELPIHAHSEVALAN